LRCTKCDRELVIPVELLLSILEQVEENPPIQDEFTGNVNVNDYVTHYSDDPIYEKENEPVNDAISEETEYFTIGFPVNFEQREIINRAIEQAKKEFKVTTSTEALLQICMLILEDLE
jgi:hypothetical protein